MIVPVHVLQEGCIVKSDVYAAASIPLLKGHTVITERHLSFLRAFFIKEVDVEHLLADGQIFSPALSSTMNKEESLPAAESSFFDMYTEAVQLFKKEFERWQAGMPVSVHELRTIMLPLFEKVIKDPEHLMSLHQFSHKCDYQYHHSVSVGLLSASLGYKLQYESGDWIQIGLAGLLSDIGMAKIASTSLNKGGPLTAFEFEDVKKHPIYSYKMVKDSTGLTAAAKLAILQHHERTDRQGYPMAIGAEKLHPYSEIIAVADVYHAMSSERPHRAKHSIYYILEEMRRQNFGPLNIPAVLALTEQLLQFTVGASVRLNTEEEGEIIFVTPQDLTKPMVKLYESGEIINLNYQTHIYIEDILSKKKS
ncbi:HD-GYP domain-containing protein [Alkalicoccobacillus porphyridii]|uniref:HD-GYP domain-containing protein n=1 Tax=Alkalicoccobacillus porphyridii TaxID=2597270 RepID=A0A554A1I2_9BACI|nr:HD-GYP domain-containing protein [Alkalicoccobacillus porphyridii]TSB47548.1 HD-GYP domain-containing protein [Alkalicoccobacillus porphyridii]